MPWANAGVRRCGCRGTSESAALRRSIADGRHLQFADVHLINGSRLLREGAKSRPRFFDDPRDDAGRLVSDDLPRRAKQVRWFPALVSNHVVD